MSCELLLTPDGSTPKLLAGDQTIAAEELLSGDFANELHWPWPALGELVGPVLPGDFWIVGARPGNGKTTVLMNLLDGMIGFGKRVVYAGMETSPERLRLQLAAWQHGYEWKHVARKAWSQLPPDARTHLRTHLQKQRLQLADQLVMVSDERLNVPVLVEWMRFAGRHGYDAVFVDHLHRMDWGSSGADLTGVMGEGVVALKSMAKEYGVRLIAAAQLKRTERDVLGDYTPPTLQDLKQSGTLEQEADNVLMLYRGLSLTATTGDLAAVRSGRKPVSDVAEPGCLTIRVTKCRLDGDVRDQDVRLWVRAGRIYGSAEARERATFEDRYGI